MTQEAAAADPSEPAPAPTSLHRELHRAWRTTVQLGVSLACTWTVALLVRFAIPRHLGPAAFGDLSFAETFTAGFFVFASLGIDTYAMREIVHRPKHASDFFGGVHVVRVFLSVALMLLILVVLIARDKSPELILAAEIWALTHALIAMNISFSVILQAMGVTERLAIANVIAKVAWGVGLLGALFWGNVEWLWLFVVPALASEILRAWLIYPAARKAVGLEWRVDFGATRRVIRASFPYFLGAIAIALGAPLNFMALELLKSDSHELGWYGATLNLATLAMIFSPILQWVQLPLLARARAKSDLHVNSILSYSIEALMVVSIPMVLIGALGGPFFVALALGEAYAPATLSFQVLVVMFVFTYAAIILATGLITHGHGWSLSTLSIANVLAAPALSFLLIPLMGEWVGPGGEAAGAAIALAATEVLVVALAIVRVGTGLLTPRLVKAVLKSLVVCAIVVAIDRALRDLGSARLLLDLAFYAGLALAFRVIDVRELRQLVRNVKSARHEPSDPPPQEA